MINFLKFLLKFEMEIDNLKKSNKYLKFEQLFSDDFKV